MDKAIVTLRSLSMGDHPLLGRLTAAGYQVVFPSPGAQPTEEQLGAAIGDAVGYLAGVERVSAALLARAGRLGVISWNFNTVDVAAARARIAARAEAPAFLLAETGARYDLRPRNGRAEEPRGRVEP